MVQHFSIENLDQIYLEKKIEIRQLRLILIQFKNNKSQQNVNEKPRLAVTYN